VPQFGHFSLCYSYHSTRRLAHILEHREEKLYGAEFPDYFKLSGVPLPEPLENFDVDKAKPRPYRPLGGGTIRRCVRPFKLHTYFVDAYQARTLALKKLEHNFWIELESSYRERIVQRKALYALMVQKSWIDKRALNLHPG
jgi:hypothetical protein